jgi:hypothetical protein
MLTVEIAQYENLPEEWKLSVPSQNKYTEYLVVKLNDFIIRVQPTIWEPEDCLFTRDLAWIKDVIEEVYSIGRQDGFTEGQFNMVENVNING